MPFVDDVTVVEIIVRTYVLNLRIDNIVKRLTVVYRLVKRLQNTMNVLLRVLTHDLIVLLGPKYFGWGPTEIKHSLLVKE